MQKLEATVAAFQFKRAKTDLIQVFNDRSYLMAEYNARTGTVSWQRLLLAGQREIVEQWLRGHYPVQPESPHKPTGPQPSAKVAQALPHRKRLSPEPRTAKRR